MRYMGGVMNKKNLARLIVLLFPFIWVWVLAVCTAWTYDPMEIFADSDWATLTIFYYLAIAWIGLWGIEAYFKCRD